MKICLILNSALDLYFSKLSSFKPALFVDFFQASIGKAAIFSFSPQISRF